MHAGVVAALFWGLVANAVVATQIVEDGTWSSLVVCPVSCAFCFFLLCLFVTAMLCWVCPYLRIGDLPVAGCRTRRDANYRRSIKPSRLPSRYQSFRNIEHVAFPVRISLLRYPRPKSITNPPSQP